LYSSHSTVFVHGGAKSQLPSWQGTLR